MIAFLMVRSGATTSYVNKNPAVAVRQPPFCKGGLMNYYEIYDRESDVLLAFGTARECRKQLGCASMDTFYALASRSIRGINKMYRVVKKRGSETDYPVLGEERTDG